MRMYPTPRPGEGTPPTPPSFTTVLSLHGVTKVLTPKRGDGVTAVDFVDLDIHAGDFAILTGRSGCGKTTLLNTAAGLLRPTSGKVLLGGADLWALSDASRTRLRSKHIGFVSQFPSLIPRLSALENVVLPTVIGGRRQRGNVTLRAGELLQLVGVAGKSDARPAELSVGEQQRVAIARALVLGPSILIADEPMSNLDEFSESELMTLLHRLNMEKDLTILMVTHGSDPVSYASRHLRMCHGKLVGESRPADFYAGSSI